MHDTTAGSTVVTILRRPQVEARTGCARSTLYCAMKAGTFPKAVKLGARSVGWLSSEVDEWLAGRIAASRPAAASK
jgi:prophage regulatory protein